MAGSSDNYPSLNYGSDFPTSIDGTSALSTFPVNTSNDYVTSQDMNLVQDAVLNIEKKLGIDDSAEVTSIDYILKNTTGGHDHDGSDSKKLTGLTATHFDDLDGSTITNLTPENIATGNIVVELTFDELATFSSGIDLTGDITVTGTVDGVDIAALDSTVEDVINSLVPIGTIIPFYDFNGTLTFDTEKWAYCDGSTATLTGIGSQTLPDLSGRYLVGFGTDGGGDNDSASWNTAAVGNASHQINLSHTHTGGTLQFPTATVTVGGHFNLFKSDGSTQEVLTFPSPTTVVASGSNFGQIVTTGSWYTGATNGGVTGSGGSSAQSIQPRSIRVRFLMRIT